MTPDFRASAEGRELAGELSRPPLEVDPSLLDEVTDSDSPRGVVALVSLPRQGADALPVDPDGLYLYAEGIQDPGNLGALARVVEAVGGTGLALATGSVSPNHPRALRASAGSLLRLPVAVGVAAAGLDARLAEGAPRWAALVPRGGQELSTAGEVSTGAWILAVGAEGPGLSNSLARRADLLLTIPLAPPVESLNTTVAAAVALFEIRRRRRTAG